MIAVAKELFRRARSTNHHRQSTGRQDSLRARTSGWSFGWKAASGESTNRKSQSGLVDRKHRQRLLDDSNWINHVINKGRGLAESLCKSSDIDLHGHTSQLRLFRLGGASVADESLLTLAIAAVIESTQRTLGLTLFDVQIHAGIVISLGAAAEMQTGEGKTLSGVLPAYLHSLSGRGVHVATTNDYLADRDHAKLSGVYRQLNTTTGVLRANAPLQVTQQAYHADITFGPGHAFGFDYLRDQLTRQQWDVQPLGAKLLDRMDPSASPSQMRQRGLHCAIVDEIDHVLIDDAVSPLLLSSDGRGESPDADVHVAAREQAIALVVDQDFCINRQSKGVTLTDLGFDCVYADQSMTIHPELVRPWHEYVVLALRAMHVLRRDVDYVVADEKIQIVDPSTGRIFSDRTWSEGLHQAVQASQQLPITPQTRSLARLTRQQFYRYYNVLGGMTGTAADCKREFQNVYGLPVTVIPTREPSRRQMTEDVVADSEASKLKSIATDTQRIHQSGRPVLIGTLDIAQSERVAESLTELGLAFELLNGVQDADEAAVIANAGHHSAITVATNLAGRGTDIQLDDRARELGGLHVIVTERHTLARVDRQLIGRCARCGDPGTATFYLSPDDKLAKVSSPWIGTSIRRRLAAKQTDFAAIFRQLQQSQRQQQRRASAIRMQTLKSDQANARVQLRGIPAANLANCCQL